MGALWLQLAPAPVHGQGSEQVAPGSLEPLPEPDVGRLEASAQRQLQEAAAGLDRLLAEPTTSVDELAEAFGYLGKLYYVYDFSDLAQICFRNARSLEPGDADWHYYLAALDRLDGEWSEVEMSLARVLELRPDDVPSLVRLGEARLELGNLAGAESAYGRVVELAPQIAAGYAGRGQVAYRRGNYVEAISDLERALELQPEATSLHHRLGMAYRQAGDLAKARSHLESNRGGYLRFPDPLVTDLGSLVESTQLHLNAGIAAAKKGDLVEAVAQFRLAVEDQPDDYLSAYNLGLALMQTGERAEGAAWIQKSVELDPDFRNGHYNLANLYIEDGRLAEATHHLQEAHRIDPEDFEAHLDLATALSGLGRNEEAITELRELLETHPREPEALLNLGTLLMQAERTTEALEFYARLLEVGGDPEAQLVAHLQVGTILEQSGRMVEALDHFRAAVELDATSVAAQASLAAALGRTGDFAAAAEQYSRLIELAPARLDAHFGRAMAAMLAENYLLALAGLEGSLEVHPDSVALRHALARLLATCPDPRVRNGPRAVELAEAVLREEFNLEHAETLAMAFAEVGRFEEAVTLQSRVVDEAQRAGRVEIATRAERRLEGYRRGEPCRAPWRGG